MLSKDIVLHEAEGFLIINKPAGVSVHGGEKVTGEILTDSLVEWYPEIKNVGDEPHFRPGIVHRLDKDTSGVMVVARTQGAYEELKQQFMTQGVEKRYIGLACGVIKKDFWEMKSVIGRSKKRFTKQVSLPVPHDEEHELHVQHSMKEGKEAVTEFEVIERLQSRYTLLYAYPKTGRMHQIRVHLASYGFPIACDSIYGDTQKCCPKNLGRLFLHAESISFMLGGEKHEFHAEMPGELQSFLNRLRVAKN